MICLILFPRNAKSANLGVMDDEKKAISEMQKKGWAKRARSFLRMGAVEAQAAKAAPAKEKRQATYRHLIAMDKQLTSVVPGGLSKFEPTDTDDLFLPTLSRPCLVVHEDSGPVPFAARWFREQHMGLREISFADP